LARIQIQPIIDDGDAFQGKGKIPEKEPIEVFFWIPAPKGT
jgi:hypothetical protein